MPLPQRVAFSRLTRFDAPPDAQLSQAANWRRAQKLIVNPLRDATVSNNSAASACASPITAAASSLCARDETGSWLSSRIAIQIDGSSSAGGSPRPSSSRCQPRSSGAEPIAGCSTSRVAAARSAVTSSSPTTSASSRYSREAPTKASVPTPRSCARLRSSACSCLARLSSHQTGYSPGRIRGVVTGWRRRDGAAVPSTTRSE